MQKILVMIGGIATESINQKLFGFVEQESAGQFEFVKPDLSKLPFFTQDLEDNPPEVVKQFQAAVKSAAGVLFITPEYNRSYPGVLKNAIDWASRPYGNNLWTGKPGAIMGASIGVIGTFGAQQHLRLVLSFLNMRLLAQPEFYFAYPQHVTEDGQLQPESAKFLRGFIQTFADWVGKPGC